MNNEKIQEINLREIYLYIDMFKSIKQSKNGLITTQKIIISTLRVILMYIRKY